MKIIVHCPKCGTICTVILEKTLPLNKDILVKCSKCKMVIPISLYKTKYNNVW